MIHSLLSFLDLSGLQIVWLHQAGRCGTGWTRNHNQIQFIWDLAHPFLWIEGKQVWKIAGLDVSHLEYITLQLTAVQLLFKSKDKGFLYEFGCKIADKKKAKPGNHFLFSTSQFVNMGGCNCSPKASRWLCNQCPFCIEDVSSFTEGVHDIVLSFYFAIFCTLIGFINGS